MTAPHRRWSFTIRDILWATVTIALLFGWATERYRRRQAELFPHGLDRAIYDANLGYKMLPRYGSVDQLREQVRAHGRDLAGHAYVTWQVELWDRDSEAVTRTAPKANAAKKGPTPTVWDDQP
jgi:hypothetical protein